ncbi:MULTISPECIES: PadR family transcriptional regulator [unclassified Microbacterium]|uniref:PadR family transcriptional regulator n=1 Tax=unclassified Microbacterium TaxID=2609290 RepID=UPI000EA890A2|nr:MULTISPECIES: PadR family transcriptional regulator [unclassified Microbacterium]MBT2486081.1 PadR family transcriptional regulator [Microbacterium sp. ISL-108]RKN68812.1 PadR family transcriptional regulator [Microbacterium sp. CGR2]
MQFLILGILLDGPLALYDVHKRFTGGISLFYAASFGSIQRALRQLEAQGWVLPADAADTRRRRKLYAVTDTGRQTWREWMLSPLSGSDAEPLMLARIYLLGSLPAGERRECIAVVRARLTEDGNALTSLATELDSAEIPAASAEVFRYRRATLDYGIRSHTLALTWLDQLEHDA